MIDRTHMLKSDKYHLIRELGRGGMGVVYLAEDKTLKREVALKVLYEHLNRQSTFAARFQEEARSVSTLHHPNIVYINGLVQTESEIAIDMEYVEGQSLRELVDHSRMTPHIAVSIARDVLNGLATCHSIGIIHRDIKPSNILINQSGTAKLTDFGLATAYASHLEETVQTDASSGFYMGTPRYMPAQAWEGDRPKPFWDLYSFGLVLYELLTGRAAFPGNNPMEIVRNQVRCPVPDLSMMSGSISPELIELVEAMLRSTLEEQEGWGSIAALEALEATPECSKLCDSNSTPTVPIPRPRLKRKKVLRWAKNFRAPLIGAGIFLAIASVLLATDFALFFPGAGNESTSQSEIKVIPPRIPLEHVGELYVAARLVDSDGASSSGYWRIALDDQGIPQWLMGYTETGIWSIDVGEKKADDNWTVSGGWGSYASPQVRSVQRGTIAGALIWKRDVDTMTISMVCTQNGDNQVKTRYLVLWLNDADQDAYGFLNRFEKDRALQGLLYTGLVKRHLDWAQRVEGLLPAISGGRLSVPRSAFEINLDGVLSEPAWSTEFFLGKGRIGVLAPQAPWRGPSLKVRWNDECLVLGVATEEKISGSHFEIAIAPGVGSAVDSRHVFFVSFEENGACHYQYYEGERGLPWNTLWPAGTENAWAQGLAEDDSGTQMEIRIPLGPLRDTFPTSVGKRWRMNAQWIQESDDGSRKVIARWGDENILAVEHGVLLIFEGDTQ